MSSLTMTSVASSSPHPPTPHRQSSVAHSTPVDLLPAIYLPERLASLLIPSRSPSLPTKIKLPFILLPDNIKQQLTVYQDAAIQPAEQHGFDRLNLSSRGAPDVPFSVLSTTTSSVHRLSLPLSLPRSIGNSTIIPRPGTGLRALTPINAALSVNSLDKQMMDFNLILGQLGEDQGGGDEQSKSDMTGTVRPGSVGFPVMGAVGGIDEVDVEVCFLCGGESRRSGVVLIERGGEGWQWVCKGGCGE